MTEKLNQHGIMEGSILTVRVIEARDLLAKDMNGLSDPYTILQIEGQRIQTKTIEKTLNPVWNESFTFDITEGREPL